MNSAAEHLRVRNPVVGVHGGGLYVSELQYTRLLEATFAVVGTDGYRGMAVRRIAERAGISSKTFYDLFEDAEDCFLAAFDYGVAELTSCAQDAYGAERDWLSAVRAGLAALLGFLDGEPALRRLVFLEALGVGPRVLARRSEVLGELAKVVDRGREGMEGAGELPPLTAEGVVGAAFALVHQRLSQQPGEQSGDPLLGMLNGLMATIVLPYRGRGVAARELTRPAAQIASTAVDVPRDRKAAPTLGSAPPVDFRLTVRTQMVLAALKQLGEESVSPSNREISDLVGVADQGQISRLMMRLQEQGLVENTHRVRQAKAWQLTGNGREVLEANQPLDPEHTQRIGKLQRRSPNIALVSTRATRTPGGRKAKRAPGFRVTTRTRLVLDAVARLDSEDDHPSNREVASAAGVKDQGQISKLLSRLQKHGLVQNTGGQTAGIPNAWQLTPQGEQTLNTGRAQSAHSRRSPSPSKPPPQ